MANEFTGYKTSREHVFDELEHLDLILSRHLACRKRFRRGDYSGPLPGWMVNKDEIFSMLSTKPLESVDIDRSHPDYNKWGDEILKTKKHIQGRSDASNGIALALLRLTKVFNLGEFEKQCIVMCLAPELDQKYDKIFAHLYDDVSQTKPTIDLVLNLFTSTPTEKFAARNAFSPHAPLIKYRLLHVAESKEENSWSFMARPLMLDDRITNFLLDDDDIDPQLQPAAQFIKETSSDGPETINDEVCSHIVSIANSFLNQERSGEHAWFYFYGRYGSGRRVLAEMVCNRIGAPLIATDVAKLLDGSFPFEDCIWRLCREIALEPAVLCLENIEALLNEDSQSQSRLELLFEAMRTFDPMAFILGPGSPSLPQWFRKECCFELECPMPDVSTRKSLWEKGLNGSDSLISEENLFHLATKFNFTPGKIKDVLSMAQSFARSRPAQDWALTIGDLYAACRAQTSYKLGQVARKIEPCFGWDDIVLPHDQREQLQEMVSHINNKYRVMDTWGFNRKFSLGRGISTLFSGPSGTGKTMAAEIIARDLSLDLYKIDLSSVVSKYIGETEKNLSKIFSEAEESNAILFFDEADALFGKRSEVKDAHDRYANIEIAYLLQRMEEYQGVVILATNLKKNMDEAFVRRIRFIIDFPFPSMQHRENIWKVTFPREAPVSSDVDYRILASKLKIAGGNIKNIGLRAAHLASAESESIHMKHILLAARRELQKMGKQVTDEDLKGAQKIRL